MKKTIILPIIFSILFLLNYPTSQLVVAVDNIKTRDELSKDLWAEFYDVRTKENKKFKKLELYGVNDSLTQICFISDEKLYMFYYKHSDHGGESRIELIQHAKLINYSGINRISYEKDEDAQIGFFKLWTNGHVELSVGGG